MYVWNFALEIIKNKHLIGDYLSIDNKHFISCTLIDCVLEYSGGDICFEQTTLRGCRHVFYGPARGTLHYLQNVGLMPFDPTQWGEIARVVH